MALHRKLQSAMEYLMTYGWAILAIAIVMVSLYSLGIFNTGSLQPTATPGSCEIVRTTAQTSLAGQCSSLAPKYIARLNQYGYVGFTDSGKLNFDSNFSISMWAYYPSLPTGTYSMFLGAINVQSSGMGLDCGYVVNNQNVFMCAASQSGYYPQVNFNIPKKETWYHYVFTYGSNTMRGYTDGKLSNYTTTTSTLNANKVSQILVSGVSPWFATTPSWMNGSIANVQIYNSTLDNATVKALYQEGIGGVPIDLKHSVAWWPLNGNANDYSGNNNQGTATNVIWNANWQSGYSSPSS